MQPAPRRLVVVALLLIAAACGLARAQDVIPPTVTDITADGTLLPDATLDFAPSEIVVTFSEDIDPATVSVDTFRLVRSGGDGTFGDGNEVEIVPVSVTLTAADEATMDLGGAAFPDDVYQLVVSRGDVTGALAAHWRLDEASGGVAFDSSENANDGTVNGALWTTGRLGGALDFDGVDDYVDLDYKVGPDLDGRTAISIAAWVYLHALPADSECSFIFGTRVDAAAAGAELYFRTTAGSTYIRAGGRSRSKATGDEYQVAEYPFSTVGSWVHVAGVLDYENDSIKLYVDGMRCVEQGAIFGASSYTLGAPTEEDVIAAYPHWVPPYLFDGLMDDVRVYGRRLSDIEMQVLAGVTPPVSDVAGNILDGEYTGALPSGDGTAGGDFVCTFTVDAVVPSVMSTTPAHGGTDVHVDTAITVTFSERMNETDTALAFSISPVVAGTAVCTGSVLTFTPDADLPSETLYTVTIDMGAKDLTGKPIAADYVFTFTTRDAIPPAVTDVTADGTTPLPGAILTSAPSSIVVTFSEDIDPATATTNTFRLVGSGGDGTFGDGNEVAVAPAPVTLSPGNVATMDLTGATLVNDDYQVTVGQGIGPTTGLVAHWKFDEASGQTAYDSSGNGNHATLGASAAPEASDPSWVVGKVGSGAVSFDDDLVMLPEGVLDGQCTVTCAFWLKGAGWVVSAANAGNDNEFFLFISPGFSRFATGEDPGTWVDWSVYPPDGLWCHVALVRDASVTQATLYLNGVSAGAKSATLNPLQVDAGGLLLGQDQDSVGGGFDPGQALAGALDDLRIYDRALSAAEIAALASPLPVTDLSANPLDGEFAGSFPSGDGMPGGDFVCTFTIDDVTAPASVTDLSLSAGDESVTVGWRNPFDADFAGVVVLRRVDADPTGTPTGGVRYDVGSAIGDGFVVYVGTGTASIPGDRSSWENTGLLNGAEYHYAVFAFDEALNYSPGVSASAVAGASGGGDGGLCSPGSSASPLVLLLPAALLAVFAGLRSSKRGDIERR